MAHSQILNRYLLKEVVLTLLGVMLVLLLMFVSGQLVKLYGKAASGTIETTSILMNLGLRSVSNLVILLPMSFFIAILLTFSRLYNDNEMVVMAATGVSQWRMLRAISSLAIVFMILVGWLSLYVSPWAESTATQLTEESKKRGDIDAIASGRFKELTNREGVIYVEEYDQESIKMKNVFVQQYEEGKKYKQDSIIRANSGYRMTESDSGYQFLILENGFRYDKAVPLVNEDGEFLGTERSAIIKFNLHGIRIESDDTEKDLHLRHKATSSKELWERGQLPDIAELQWRVSAALLCIVLCILAVPLSKVSPRQGRYTKLAIALLLFIIYFYLLNISKSLVNKGDLSPMIGLWWVHIVMLLFSLSLFVQWRPLLRQLLSRRKKQ